MEVLKHNLTSRIPILRMLPPRMVVAFLVLCGLGLRLALAPFTSHPYDFASWTSTMERFYNLSISPLYWWKFGTFLNAVFILSYALYLCFLQLIQAHSVLLLHVTLKIPFILADMGIAVVLYALAVKKGASWRNAAMLMSLWLLNPFAIFVSAVHGGTDAAPAFFVLLSVYFLQQNKLLRGFVSLLVGGMFKYYPLLLVPVFVLFSWRRTDRKMKGIGLISLVIILIANYAPVLLDPLKRDRWFSGLTSSMVPSSESSPWSLWILPRLIGFNLSTIAFSTTLIGAVAYLLFLAVFVWKIVRRKFELEEPDVLKAYLAVIIIFVALIPISNPQFLLWILPLLLYFSFAMNKPIGYTAATILWLFNLAALFVSFSPQVYLLDSIPKVFTFGGFAWPYVNSSISVLFKAVYSLLLLFVLIETLTWTSPLKKINDPKIERKPRSARAAKSMMSQSLFRTSRDFVFAIAMNLLVASLFFSLVFYPAWVSTYFQEPSEKPFDLYRLNEIQYPSTVTVVSSNSRFVEISTQVHVDLAPWLRESGWKYANSSLIIRMAKETSEHLLVSHDKAGNAALVSSNSRIDQVFSLREGSMALKFKVLMEEPQEYTESELKNLRFSLFYWNGNLVQSYTADKFQREMVVKGVFFYSFTVVKPLISGMYNLSASVENSTLTWYWNGGDSASSIDERYVNGHPTGVNSWFQVYEVPSFAVYFNNVSLGQVVANITGNCKISLNNHPRVIAENDILLITNERTREYLEEVFVEVKLDIRPKNPWWIHNTFLVYALAAVGLTVLASAAILLARLVMLINPATELWETRGSR